MRYQINFEAAAETHEKTGEAGDAWLEHDADAGTPTVALNNLTIAAHQGL